MDTLQAIRTRRSIRKFLDEPVEKKLIKKIIAAAMQAPSAGNERPWHFVVVSDRELLGKITRIHPYSSMLRDSHVAILVCGDKNLEVFDGYWIQDCSAAVQNMLLAAHSLGLGAVWLGIYPVIDRVMSFQKLFELPDSVIPLALVPVGVPGENPPPVDRYDNSRVHMEKW